MVQKDFVGDRMRAFALSKHLSIKEFADFIGMDAGNVQKYLNGKRKPGTPLLQRLQKNGCNLDWLLTGEGEMYTKKEGNQEKEIDPEEERESHSNTIKKQQKQPFNSHLTDAARMYQFPPDSITKALGKRMCVYGIQEGDIIILDDKNEPNESDLVLQIKNDVPTIEKFQPGDPKPYAICVRLQRNLKAPEKPRTDL